MGFNGYKKLQNFQLAAEPPRTLCCICVGKCIDDQYSLMTGSPPSGALNWSYKISTYLTAFIINAFAKVSQKLRYFVFMLFGLLLASGMFCFAAKSYRQSVHTIPHSSINPDTNLDTNLATNPDTNSGTRVNQTVLWLKNTMYQNLQLLKFRTQNNFFLQKNTNKIA